MPLDDYSEAELQPRNLTPEEIENPETFISDFFAVAHLPQWRDIMWTILRNVVIGDYKSLPTKEKANLISFFEKISKLIEVAYVIEKRRLRK